MAMGEVLSIGKWYDGLAPWAQPAPTVPDGVGDTRPVGDYSSGQSPYGAMNMTGNPEEWVNDWYQEDYYSVSPKINPQGPETGTDKVVRSGSFGMVYYGVRVAVRTDGTQLYNLGFRCAASPGD